MALITPYLTITEANSFLTSSIWEDAEIPTKQHALEMGRLYLDSTYSCIEFDEVNPPEAIKYANALLAEDFLQGYLIKKGGTVEGTIKKKRSKAGPVETETEYIQAKKVSYQQDVDLILKQYCSRKSNYTLRI